ncbi:MAG: dihydropteridine reductase [Clostridia bacterium]|nr:dihydropteridine reductase [Clostridia bacterium]
MNNNDQKFIAEKIRTQYVEKESSKLDALVELDKRVKRPADVLGYSAGSVGALVLGTGMSMVMTAPALMAAGIAVGIVGLAATALNYPLYKRVLAARRKKHADEILQLSQEIVQDAQNGEKAECCENPENGED